MADERTSAEHDDRPFAVLDVGSNSARMIVFRLRAEEHLDVIEDARAPLRLARELHAAAELGPEAIERTLEALRDFRAVAEGAGADRILAVATSAVRDALDGHLLLERARELGVPLQIIDGDTEARLGFVGAVHDLPVTSGATLDVGGGSAEISRFHDRRLARTWSFELGSLRVSDRFLDDDPPTGSQLKRLRKSVGETLRDADIDGLTDGEVLVGIGGTVRNLAKVDMHRTEHPLGLLHGYELPADRLEVILGDLASKTMTRRAQIAGLNPDRADSVIGGAIVLLEIMSALHGDRIVVSSRGVREGLALGGPDAALPPPRWVRTISIATLSARFATWDPNAADRRTMIATRLHDSLDPEARDAVREMLVHASTVLDVGRAIDYYDRFEHAAMIVTSADLGGFTHETLGILSAILRQADDDIRLGPYRRLIEGEDRSAVLRAATVLALADELKRRIPPELPAVISCTWHPAAFVVGGPFPSGWRPHGVAERFRQVFGRPLHVLSSRSAQADGSGTELADR
ncbi:MAG: Ppx/GppA phosphatase family protein [Actinomycetota bacterium]